MMDCNAVTASRTRFLEMPAFCRSLVGFYSVFHNLPSVNQRCLLVPEIHLQPKTIFVFNNRSDCGFFDSASVQVHADVLASPVTFVSCFVLVPGFNLTATVVVHDDAALRLCFMRFGQS